MSSVFDRIALSKLEFSVGKWEEQVNSWPLSFFTYQKRATEVICTSSSV